MAPDTSRISPTAHYTGFVWYRNGLSDPALKTRLGWMLYHAAQPLMRASRALGGPGIEDVLLARHAILDHLLVTAIERGDIGQVVEVAAGLSPRGRRFMERFGDRGLVYVEGDLPAMCARKRERLQALGPLARGHHLVAINALDDRGPRSLAAVAGRLLDPGVGTAVVTEGLVNYFDRAAVTAMWARISDVLAGFERGLYVSDLHVQEHVAAIRGARVFRGLVSMLARGRVHLHFPGVAAAESALLEAGFARASVRSPGAFARALALSPRRSAAPVAIITAEARPRGR